MYNNIYHDIRVDNLTKIMEDKYGSWNSLCKTIGKSSSYMNEVIKGIKREFTENLAREVEAKLQLNPGSLDIKNSALEERRYAMVNIYSPVLSAGDGNDIFSEDHLGELSVPMQLVKEKHLDVGKLACLRVEGDSMEQKINNGAYVIIDTSKKEIVNNKIYAFNINNVIRVKRLFNALDGIIIRSDNPTYPEEKVTFEDMQDNDMNFFVVGKIEIILNME
jgi:phage repressor protein C with HTH and peptisase S24 domain